jgi:ABC-type polysaccharide/polyol phosphate export permease
MVYQFTALWTFRHFLLALVRLDLRTRYKRSLLGVGWNVLQPLAMTGVFVVVFSNVLGLAPETYTTMLLLGLAVWGFFREAAVTGCQAFTAHETYIRQSPLPFGLYPLRTVLGQAIHSSLALGVAVLAVVVLDGSFQKLSVLWAVVPVLALLVACGWAVATIFAFAQVYFHDTKHLLEIGSQVLFFLTPIIYPVDNLVGKGLGWMAKVNPVNLFLELIRTPLATGELPPAKLYLYAAGCTALLVGTAVLAIAGFRKKLVYHL